MEKRSVAYLVGIGGWEHEAFDKCFYPSGGGDGLEKLRYYARFFETVEVRPTFWDDTLAAEDAARWVDAVVDNRRFLFNIKLHLSFTHKKELKPVMARQVRGVLQELAKNDRLGALLMQFPYSFTNTSAHRFHILKLGELFSGFPVHVELRHESWNHGSMMNFLAETGLHLVSVDLPRVKQFMPFSAAAAGDTAYVRFHGRNEKGWLLNGIDARYDYLYNDREIRELKRRVEALTNKCKRVILIFNNTTGGKAIANALQLGASLREGKHALMPRATLNAFPHLHTIACVADAEHSLMSDLPYRQAM
jgi:uncharacterized protein YecE (DUF72 family)